jgi:hypothetical protein
MNMREVKEKAKALGINSFGMKKVDLIRAIQSKEGNNPCFMTGLDLCDQYNCCWRSECFPEKITEKKEIGERESYLKKAKAELEEFNDKLDDLKEKAKRMVGKAKADALEEIISLEKKTEVEIKQKMHKLVESSEDVWQTTKKKIDRSWKEVRESFKNAFSRHSSEKK